MHISLALVSSSHQKIVLLNFWVTENFYRFPFSENVGFTGMRQLRCMYDCSYLMGCVGVECTSDCPLLVGCAVVHWIKCICDCPQLMGCTGVRRLEGLSIANMGLGVANSLAGRGFSLSQSLCVYPLQTRDVACPIPLQVDDLT